MPKRFDISSTKKYARTRKNFDVTDEASYGVPIKKKFEKKHNAMLAPCAAVSSGASHHHNSSSLPNKTTRLQPRNDKQKAYMEMLHTSLPHIVIATGSAGTGKTMLATHVGVLKLLNHEVDRIVITRPAVSVDEAHGFLPGTLEKKMEPWMRPIFDTLGMHFPRNKLDSMVKEKIIEMCPMAFMRGRTFENAWIICDEAQNTTVNQMLMVLTRIGPGSKMIITGDPNQHDRGYNDNGLSDLIQRVRYQDCSDQIQIVEFEDCDVERHEVIPLVLNLYKSM